MARNVTHRWSPWFSLITAGTASTILFISAAAFAEGAKAAVVSATASVPGTRSPLGLFDGSGFETQGSAEFVKVSLLFDPPLVASKVSLESCGGDFKDGVEFFVLPGSRRVYAEGGFETLTSVLVPPGSTEGSTEVRSLAINFRHNQPVCIKALHFKDQAGATIEVKIRPERAPKTSHESNVAKLRSAFLESGVSGVLDEELAYKSENEKWFFRFRSDGSFFLFGTNDDVKGAGRFTVLGTFEAEREEKSNSRSTILLHLKGRRIVTAEPWDGVLCEDLCGERALANTRLVTERIAVEKISGGYMVRNRESKLKRNIPFGDLRVRASTL